MKRKILVSIVTVLLLTVLLLPLSCARPSADIVAGSSLITDIIQDIAGNKLKVHTLIPPGTCPGHYDVKLSDVEILANSKALFIHDYQQNSENVTGLVEAAKNSGLIIEVIDVKGNWMAPPVQAEAIDKIAQALCELDSANSAYYQKKAGERKQVVLAKGEEVKGRLQEAKVSGIKVICAEMQEGFVRWAGFDVVATFGRPEDLSPAQVEELISKAKETGVALVIDNLQSGSKTLGAAIEQDIEAIPVTISNFPGGLEGTETWEKAMDRNVDLLLEALAKWRQQHG